MKGASESTSPIALHTRALVVENEVIPAEYQELPLGQVLLDPDNPRIQHAVRQKSKNGKISPKDLRSLILDQPGVSALFVSIRDNGGLLEPIYVRKDGRVIEGNCRTAAYLRLHETFPNVKAWEAIPALVIPVITDRQVAVLQGSHHVAGKNKWKAYEKIGHLHTMHKRLNMEPSAIAKALGLRENDVKRDLTAYATMTDKLLPKMNGGNVLQKWSFVQELYKRKELEGYRLKEENIDEFVSMIVDGRLKRGTDVRDLEKVLQVPAAVKTLKKKGMGAAISVVSKVDPTVDSPSLKKLKQATALLEQMPSKDLQRLLIDSNSQQILIDLFLALKNVAKAANIKFGR